MKSLLISYHYFPPQVGGISRLIDQLARALGPERVCCLTGHPSDPDQKALGLYPRVYRSPALFSGESIMVRGWGWASTLPPLLLEQRPRSVLVATIADGLYGATVKRWLGIPMATMVHGNDLLEVLAEPDHSPLNRVLQQSDRVIAVSRFTAGLALRAGVPADRIEVIHPGCDATEFSPRLPNQELSARLLGGRVGSPVILTIGNLVPRKGHDMVIRALPRILEQVPGATYLIVGDGPNRANLESMATALGVSDHVVFAGQIEDADLAACYGLGDVFVMVSREAPEQQSVEGFGLVYLEASACERPVVGGRSGGVPDAIAHGDTGLLVDPNDPTDIANALVTLLTDAARRSRMGRAGRARVVRDFSWKSMADRVHDVLCSVAESRGIDWQVPSSFNTEA